MKAVLEFNLPEEHTEHYHAVMATEVALVLCDFLDWLRNQRKHGDLSEESEQAYGCCADSLAEILEDRGLSLEALVG